MASTKLTDGIRAAMIDTGRAAENWRIKVTGCDQANRNSDYVRVYVEVYKPRSRKPDIIWDICVNIAKNLIYWEYSTFVNIK